VCLIFSSNIVTKTSKRNHDRHVIVEEIENWISHSKVDTVQWPCNDEKKHSKVDTVFFGFSVKTFFYSTSVTLRIRQHMKRDKNHSDQKVNDRISYSIFHFLCAPCED